MIKTFVIGDVHGHLDRLEALLLQEEILIVCPDCNGTGDNVRVMCDHCDGDGIRRSTEHEHPVEVVQLGDLGHFGGSEGSPTGDFLCYSFARKGWVDHVLWGNHDAAVFDSVSAFKGYFPPSHDLKSLMIDLEAQGKLKWAHSANGFLITHAGLHKQWKYTRAPVDKDNPDEIADWLNRYSIFSDRTDVPQYAPIFAVARKRGGSSPYGGILWRDHSESLYPIPQVYGHSANRDHEVRMVDESYNIDIGGKPLNKRSSNDCLAGIWLPEQKVVRVDLKGS